MSRRTGFSLLELIIIIMVVAFGTVAIGAAFTYINRTQRLTVEIAAATQIAQECAAHVVGLGRHPGSYAAVAPVAAASTICNALPAPAAPFQRVVNVTNMPAGGTLCSAGWQCKRIEILVTRPGSDLVALDFMLVNY
jgi:type II secretory pathway pseudopilin PulG